MTTPIQALAGIAGALAKFEVDICAALAHSGTHHFDDVILGVLDGSYDVFYNEGGVVLCEISDHPLSRAYHIFVAAGKMDAVLALRPEVAAKALSLGCDKLTMTGRLGWQRALVNEGWTAHAIHMTSDLT